MTDNEQQYSPKQLLSMRQMLSMMSSNEDYLTDEEVVEEFEEKYGKEWF